MVIVLSMPRTLRYTTPPCTAPPRAASRYFLRHAGVRLTAALTRLSICVTSSTASRKRWDGKLLDPTPKISTLPPQLVAQIGELTVLDAQLYQVSGLDV